MKPSHFFAIFIPLFAIIVTTLLSDYLRWSKQETRTKNMILVSVFVGVILLGGISWLSLF